MYVYIMEAVQGEPTLEVSIVYCIILGLAYETDKLIGLLVQVVMTFGPLPSQEHWTHSPRIVHALVTSRLDRL